MIIDRIIIVKLVFTWLSRIDLALRLSEHDGN